MFDAGKWWGDNVAEPIGKTGGVISGEIASCMVGGCDPVAYLQSGMRGAARSITAGATGPIREEIDYLFDEKVTSTVERIDAIIKRRVEHAVGKTESAVKSVVADTATHFDTLKDEMRDDITGLLSGVDAAYKENLALTFEKINHARAEAILGLRAMLGEIDKILEARLNQLAQIMIQALAMIQELIDSSAEIIRAKVIDPTFEKLEGLEEKLFRDIDAALEKFGLIIVDTPKAYLEMFFERIEVILRNPFDKCRRELDIPWRPLQKMPRRDLYRMEKCDRLREIEDNINTWDIEVIEQTYGNLQFTAWVFACDMRRADAAWNYYMKEWAEFGRLARLWKTS